MSGAEEEETCGSNQTTPTSPLRNERRRRSKPKDPSKELNEVEKKELLRKYAETDQNLEKFAQAHNMTALNVKSVLRSVIKNHRALARVLGTDAPDDSIDGVRITRSKTRALQDSSNQGVDMTSNVPIKRGNTWVDLRFNEDDEYDNDYRPGEDDSGDEIGTDSSRPGSSDEEEEDEHLSELDKDEQREEEEDEEQDLTIVDSHEDEPMSEPSEGPLRPRPESAASLTLNAIIREDDEPSIDYREFVDNLNLDEIPYDDDEEDPEYMVPTEVIFRDERDDLMGDYWSSTIPQKEMEDLIVDIVPTERLEELANLSPPLRQIETAKPSATVEQKSPVTPTSVPAKKSERKEETREKIFTQAHRSQLSSQLEQHVQLLTQSFVGCYFEPLLQEQKDKAKGMIEELALISSLTWHLGSKSSFHISNLPSAVATCKGMEKETLEEPLKPLAKEQLIITYPLLSITKKVLASSPAILYPHLVSQCRLVQSIGSSGWHMNEILLFAMALNRHDEEPVKPKLPKQGKYSIIAANCLPWRTMNELRWQYNGMKRGLERNGRTRHNREFFDVVEGKRRLSFPRPMRAKTGWTMCKWNKNFLPSWFNINMIKRRSDEVTEVEQENSEPEKKKRRKERRIDEGDNEIEPIVIVDSEEDDEENEIITVSLADERHNTSLADDECAMDSMGKSGEGPEEVEAARGEEGTEGQPIDFSHLMSEMSPRPGPSGMRTPSPRRARSETPNEKSMFPLTPGKRQPSPLEESTPWLEMTACRAGYDSPPPCHSPPSTSRVKTPGGAADYVDSLIGYFGTPERETMRRDGGAPSSRRANAYSNLFGDFDFDESDGGEEEEEEEEDEELPIRSAKRARAERDSYSEEERPENEDADTEANSDDARFAIPAPVRQKKKRPTREEKERSGLAAIKDSLIRRRVMETLARKAAEDIRSRMTMHSSTFKQIQSVLSPTNPKEDREEQLSALEGHLSDKHKEVLYLLAAFCPPSALPRSLVLSQHRVVLVAALNMMVIIYAYMTKVQRRLSYRQLLKIILDAHKSGGTEAVLAALKEVLVNDPLLLRVLAKYSTLPVPEKQSRAWEVVDLRKGDDAFKIFRDDPGIERVDLCDVLGGVPTKTALMKAGKPLSTLLLNHNGEPILRNEDGKYKEIAVVSERQMEEEKRSRAMEREEEKKARLREKAKERMKAARKAKMVERREERAREKRKEVERKQEEEERKKEESQAPPAHPFTRDMDRALLLMFNEVQRVTKRAVRKMAVDIPYSTNFTLDQLQARLNFLLSIADDE